MCIRDSSSSYEIATSDPVIEPQFEVSLNGDAVEFKMVNQIVDPDNPPFTLVSHNIGSELRLKYIIRRWSSTS